MWLRVIKARGEIRDCRRSGQTAGQVGPRCPYSHRGASGKTEHMAQIDSGCDRDKTKPRTWLGKSLIKASETSKLAHQSPFAADRCLLSMFAAMLTLSGNAGLPSRPGALLCGGFRERPGWEGPALKTLLGMLLFSAVGCRRCVINPQSLMSGSWGAGRCFHGPA